MKNTLIFIAFVLVVLGLLYAISGERVPPPLIPDDNLHEALNDVSSCLNCHGPDKEAAMKKTHLPKPECFKCHKTKKRGR
ncbi:MAG TPA: hypothetical protein VN328_12635 [Thermodesulfovibrionales bacterium]|nr:hypothetical protein [Thermodesulfovibrionales bacterium]